MLHVGDNFREDRAQRVIDGREDFGACQHASRAALGHEDAIGGQLRRHHGPVEILCVQLRKHCSRSAIYSKAQPVQAGPNSAPSA